MFWKIMAALILLTSCMNSEQNYNNDNKNNLKEFSGKKETATFAGGCFWCIEAPFERIDGVISAVSGYSGGEQSDAFYKLVSAGETKHRETVKSNF